MNVKDYAKKRSNDLREVLTRLDQLLARPRLAEQAGVELAKFVVGFDQAAGRVEKLADTFAQEAAKLGDW